MKKLLLLLSLLWISPVYAQSEEDLIVAIGKVMKLLIGKPTKVDPDTYYYHTGVSSFTRGKLSIFTQTKDENNDIIHYEHEIILKDFIEIVKPNDNLQGKVDYFLVTTKSGESREIIKNMVDLKRYNLIRMNHHIPFVNQGESGNTQFINNIQKLIDLKKL